MELELWHYSGVLARRQARALPVRTEVGGPSNLYWVHPDGTGLHKLAHTAVGERSYLGSGFSPSFSGGEGWITTSWFPGYGKEGNSDVARMLIEEGDVVRTTNLIKSALSDRVPDWA